MVLAVGCHLLASRLRIPALKLRKLTGHARRVVVRLMSAGVVVTWLAGATCAAPLLGLSRGAAAELGAILVVSGPTVVGPLLRWLCTRGTDLTTPERCFVGWMAPRGIVAAATAAGPSLWA